MASFGPETMDISTSISRFADYLRRNGLLATLRRASLAVRRSLLSSRSVLFYCDLSGQISPAEGLPSFLEGLPSFLKVERKTNPADIDPRDLQEMTSFWNPKLAHRNIAERFEQAASLWLIKSHDKLAGYGWTLQGRTIEPHYFPLGPDDVHLFDFYVFPQYRGRGINPLLVNQILLSLVADCQNRAFIEAAEWNQAQLSSLAKTSFRRLGWASKLMVFGRTIVWWDECKGLKDRQNDRRNTPVAVSRPERFGVLNKR
jgi:ribosomal protein S18 acetylase RimI-like enzyme